LTEIDINRKNLVFGFDLDKVLAHPTMKRNMYKMFEFYRTCTPIRVDKFQIEDTIQQELGHFMSLNAKKRGRIERRIHRQSKVYIVTGRKKRFKKTTLEWLNKHNIKYEKIYFFKGTIKSINTLVNHKSKVINKKKIKVFWEDTELIAWMLAFKCPKCEIRLFNPDNITYVTINVKGKTFIPRCKCNCGKSLDLDQPLREIKRIGFINGHKMPEYIPPKPLGDQ